VITLTAVEFEVAWGHLELGDLPPVLDLPSTGRTGEERQVIVDRVLADLRDELPELEPRLVTLARFAWAVDTRIITGTRTRARGAVAARRGVLAVLTGDRVTIRSVPEHAVAQQVTALAGTVAAGRADSVSVRAEALDAVAGRALSDGLVALGERPADARAVARICAKAHTRGQFSVRRTGRDGRQHTGDRVVGFHDTPTGRFLQLRRDGWVTFIPDTGTQLVTQVNQLLDELERTRR
jgi:ESX secretion-associated protein EspG